MYQEQPLPRNAGTLTDFAVVEYFEWRDHPSEDWAKEVQLTEGTTVSPEYPEGFIVYWMEYANIQDILAMDSEAFKAAALPKPTKRGGNPQG